MSINELTNRISPYFTAEVIQNILKSKSNCTNIEIKSINYGKDSVKGDSYLSTLCRFVIEAEGVNERGTKKSFSLPIIVKSIPKNVARRKTFRSNDFFENEIIFYEKVWPELSKFKSSKLPNDPPEVPTMLATFHDGENDFIALEDVSFYGFNNMDRSKGVNYEHTVAFLQILAKFHALSLAYKDQHPEKFLEIASALTETYFAEKYRKWYQVFQESLFNTFRVAIKRFLTGQYLDKFENLIEGDFYGLLCDYCKIRSKFSVITEGDAWLPNFLVKYGENSNMPTETMIIDFQLARYTTLTNDITFFLYACVSKDILQDHWDNLIKEYHQALSKRLSELGSNPDLITLDELKEDIQKNGTFGIGMAMEALPTSLLKDNEIADLDLIQGTEAVPLESVWMMHPFKDAERNEKLAFFIKHAVDHGIIK